MTKEVKLGLLTMISIFLAVWGYRFIKGQSLLKSSSAYYSTFTDVTGLAVSNDVVVNGFKVGTVTDIQLNPENVKSMNVYFRIDGEIAIPKETEVHLKSEGIMGGKVLSLSFDKPCTDANCAPNGTKLKSRVIGLLGSMLPENEMSNYVNNTTQSARMLLSELGKDGNNTKMDLIVRNLEASVANMNNTMAQLNKIMLQSQGNIAGITGNLNKVTKNIADNNAQITAILSNLNTTTSKVSQIDAAGSVAKANAVIDNSAASVKKLEATIASSTEAINQLNAVLLKVNEGKGSLGQLINDDQLYKNLEATSQHLSLLLQDLRLNPRRYVNVSIIGRKDKAYTAPNNDPGIEKKEKE